MAVKIPFGDLTREYRSIGKEIDDAVNRTLSSGWYVLGKELEKFERKFADYVGTDYCVGCANGTDAITIALLALGIQNGDEVITQVNTCIPTVCGIVNSKAVPQFCDVENESLMINVEDLKNRITKKTKVIIPVNLYGASADYDSLINFADIMGIPIIEDCAQSHGSTFKDDFTGTFGAMGTFSFYPSKNLGAYGDGGAVVTNDESLYKNLLTARNYGQKKRYYHTSFGLNSRLDEIQAAILSVKLDHLDAWNNRRVEIAERYNKHFGNSTKITPLKFSDDIRSVYHLYVIKTEDRENLAEHLSDKGVTTLIHYPVPCHLQEAYSYLGYTTGDFPVAESNAAKILSLPIFPQLSNLEVDYTAKCVKEFYGE